MAKASIGVRCSGRIAGSIRLIVRLIIVRPADVVLGPLVEVTSRIERWALARRHAVAAWWRRHNEKIRQTAIWSAMTALVLYVVIASVFVPLPVEENVPRPVALVMGMAIAHISVRIGLKKFVSEHQRDAVACLLWRRASTVARWIRNHPGWPRFENMIESKWLPAGMLAVSALAAVRWPSPFLAQPFSPGAPPALQAFMLPVLFVLTNAMLVTVVVFGLGVVVSVYRDDFRDDFRRDRYSVPDPRSNLWPIQLPRGIYHVLIGGFGMSLVGLLVDRLGVPSLSDTYWSLALIVAFVWACRVSITAYQAENLYGPAAYIATALGVWVVENFGARRIDPEVAVDAWIGLAISAGLALCSTVVRVVAIMADGDNRADWIERRRLRVVSMPPAVMSEGPSARLPRGIGPPIRRTADRPAVPTPAPEPAGGPVRALQGRWPRPR